MRVRRIGRVQLALARLASQRSVASGLPMPARDCENARTTQHLILRPGPQLVMRAYRPEPDDMGGRLNEVNVTGQAHAYLFECITVHAGATLGDVFRLMQASPLLLQYYRQDFADELCARHDRRARSRAVVDQLHQISASRAIHGSQAPVVQQQYVGTRDRGEPTPEASVAMQHAQVLGQARHPQVQRRVPASAGVSRQRAGEPGFCPNPSGR